MTRFLSYAKINTGIWFCGLTHLWLQGGRFDNSGERVTTNYARRFQHYAIYHWDRKTNRALIRYFSTVKEVEHSRAYFDQMVQESKSLLLSFFSATWFGKSSGCNHSYWLIILWRKSRTFWNVLSEDSSLPSKSCGLCKLCMKRFLGGLLPDVWLQDAVSSLFKQWTQHLLLFSNWHLGTDIVTFQCRSRRPFSLHEVALEWIWMYCNIKPLKVQSSLRMDP